MKYAPVDVAFNHWRKDEKPEERKRRKMRQKKNWVRLNVIRRRKRMKSPKTIRNKKKKEKKKREKKGGTKTQWIATNLVGDELKLLKHTFNGKLETSSPAHARPPFG
jgi:hypothetical protein